MPRKAPNKIRSIQSVRSVPLPQNNNNHWAVLFFVIVTLVALLVLMKMGLHTVLAVITLVSRVSYRSSSKVFWKSVPLTALLKFFR